MTKEQRTIDYLIESLKEVHRLVTFKLTVGEWHVEDIKGDVLGNVHGNIYGDVYGGVRGNIQGKHWKFVEAPKDKLKRLIEQDASKEELFKLIDLLEDN